MEENLNKIGKVFHCQRFSTHDGDGIRTVIFLKGCPLRCAWCQNPEGISTKENLIYFENKCINCKICTKISNTGAIEDCGNKIRIIKDKCTEEENIKLIKSCPSSALSMDCKTYTVKEVVEIALKDKSFYKYDGGVTLSGGEPLFQKEFAISILKELKRNGINTAIETSLFIDRDTLERALPYVDMIFADLKLFNTNEHKKYTGVDNMLIKDNIEFILKQRNVNKVTIRTPLIPNITATKENIVNICKFISDINSEVKYEMLNYNPLAKSKYDLVEELEYCFHENPKMYSEEEMNNFYQIAYDSGIKNLIK